MIPDIPIDRPLTLPRTGTWPASVHLFDQASADAVLAALAAERPLLVRGEPGAGKSQLARAAAQVLGRLFVGSVVHSRSEAQDLKWEYDAVARLGEAQVLAAVPSDLGYRERLDPRRFLIPGPLWWVFDWSSAEAQVRDYSLCKAHPPAVPDGWTPAQGAVLLIDEIDKAEADLPNALLETLGNGAFPVPWLDGPVGLRAGVPPPLVVVTTNEERELPAAFLRLVERHRIAPPPPPPPPQPSAPEPPVAPAAHRRPCYPGRGSGPSCAPPWVSSASAAAWTCRGWWPPAPGYGHYADCRGSEARAGRAKAS
jgi:MoxR-like ATPase